MEQRYLTVRTQLEELGYTQQFPLDSLPLVERLVGDLLKTTESLQKYMKLSQDILTERDSLLLGAEPYKCDNAKLVKECNELHLAFLQYRERSEKIQQDLKKRVWELEKVKTDCDKENEELRSHVKVLEEGSLKSNRQIKSSTTRPGVKPLKSSTTTSIKSRITPRETSSAMSMAENKITNLTKEIHRLKEDKLELAQANVAYKNQINSRDKEIQRLTKMLQGGRPLEALNQDCCYKDIEVKMAKLQDEVVNLKRTNSDLEYRLKDAIAKQHEAMKRALSLAERNKILEKELKDIDQMALAVEQECNSTVKSNTEKVNRLQNRLHEAILQIQQLEKEAIEMKREKHELLSELEAVKGEKRHLQGMLEASLEEKKKASGRVAQYGIIENDLNLEIDRLVQLNAEQKRKIAELECRLLSKPEQVSSKKLSDTTINGNSGKSKKTLASSKLKGKPTATRKYKINSAGDNISIGAKVPENTPVDVTSLSKQRSVEDAATSPIHTLCPQPEQCIKRLEELIKREIREKNVCLDHLKEVLGQEINELNAKASSSLDQFREERDFYKKECNALMEKLQVVCNKSEQCDLQQKLFEKEQELSKLQQELCNILQEKQSLLLRIESGRSQLDQQDYDALSARSSTKRLERERDLLRADIQHLEEERDGLRHRINMLCEEHNQEKARLENMLREREHEIRRMELDRREIVHSQGSKRATICNLQEECDMLMSQLKSCQADLTQQRVSYSQLKMLHEQSDRALADCQNQLLQADKDMTAAQEKIKMLEAQKENGCKTVVNLKNDLLVMKNNLLSFDREKDSLVQALDEKTEKLVALEHELSTKDKKIENLEATISDLRKRISDNLTERSSKEYLLKTATSDVEKLQRELEAANRARELAFEENRRLQDDLTSCTRDNKKIQNDLDIARRQVDDLRRQLQHYVAEIKRAEDLISQKEVERSEMLDHYKSLSEEATNLESTNHTLENEAAQARVQLSVALDHAADLERKVEVQSTMIRDYEKQISNLTAQIARLESQVDQGNSDKERIEAELASVRDLCLKLDKQKDNLMKQLNEKDAIRSEINRECTTLRRNSQTLQSELDKERNTVDNLEKHLAQIRQESVDMRLMNEELKSDMQRLKVNIQELQAKLTSTTEQLDLYQEKALDYSNQNKQLRREIANERFYRAKAEDGKRYPCYNIATQSDETLLNYPPTACTDPQTISRRCYRTAIQTENSTLNKPTSATIQPGASKNREINDKPSTGSGSNNSKVQSNSKITEISSEQELVDKCFQFPSSMSSGKCSGKTVPKRVCLDINHTKVADDEVLFNLSVDSKKVPHDNTILHNPIGRSISEHVIVDPEFDEEISRTVENDSDINVASTSYLLTKDKDKQKETQTNNQCKPTDCTSELQRIYDNLSAARQYLNTAEVTTKDGKPATEMRIANSISQTICDKDICDEVCKNVDDPSIINVAPPENIPSRNKGGKNNVNVQAGVCGTGSYESVCAVVEAEFPHFDRKNKGSEKRRGDSSRNVGTCSDLPTATYVQRSYTPSSKQTKFLWKRGQK